MIPSTDQVRKQEVDVKKGSVAWMKAHMHIGENIGDTNTDVIIVELKENITLEKSEKIWNDISKNQPDILFTHAYLFELWAKEEPEDPTFR